MTDATFRAGDRVEVRPVAEIMATLDAAGELDSMPFMPEMLRFCGRRMTVQKVAHKICDVIEQTGLRRLDDAYILTGARCDGSAHGGCETACTLFWRSAWLRPVDPAAADPVPPEPVTLPIVGIGATVRETPDGTRYRCQATEILRAAPGHVKLKDLDQYVRDVRTGNAGAFAVLRALFFGLFNRWQKLSRRLPRALRIRGGLEWGWVDGRAGRTTPVATLDLKPGELVRVKTIEEINATLNAGKLNRGMGFDEEMSRFCGRTARVRSRVARCLDERTGQMMEMKTPAVILEGLFCEGAYGANCPRAYVPFWREIWLDRVDDPS
ncbi:hypothetical protein EDD29_0217 [Actinocorallia herbida]|uniref:Uncharacterized protein n=1 Tax=Actinocorallia herbida TaxID=58109 RepID=A0A3N1CNJ6_9ACTN|nr:hypothetical protein [Actinocorallia herbida]ROO82734.1 hypothetical protein EDD29_0217 [Actinocorallia herbida]